MLTPQFQLPLHRELVVDLFAGGGGASTGLEMALGRPVDIAINHDREAVNLHAANHPQTRHYCSDVFEVEPMVVTEGRPVGVLWASPDCSFHSKARGGKPFRDRNRARRRRGLAGVILRWADQVRPTQIYCENVEEWLSWGPLLDNGQPCPERRGKNFQKWVARLRNLGYQVEWRELRASDYGTPTIRKRLFVIARRDGEPIVWPRQTHAAVESLPARANKLKPWRSAADCIDWSVEAPSIFGRKKPLAEATCGRIARGVVRYVLESSDPYIAPIRAPRRQGAGHAPLVAAFLAKHYTGVVGASLRAPAPTVTCIDHSALVTVQLAKKEDLNRSMSRRAGDVYAFLLKYYGSERDGFPATEPMHTIPTRDRMGLVTVMVSGSDFCVTDIGMRMLTPRELYLAQGFPSGYEFEVGADGAPLTKKAQVRMVGNSVCPPMAAALVTANAGMPARMKAAA